MKSELGHRHVLTSDYNPTELWRLLGDQKVYRKPERCNHTNRRWRGGLNWDCLD